MMGQKWIIAGWHNNNIIMQIMLYNDNIQLVIKNEEVLGMIQHQYKVVVERWKGKKEK